MTVKVAGFWEYGYITPLQENDLWIYPLRDFDIDEIYMCPITGIKAQYIAERQSLDDIYKEEGNEKLVKVFVDENGEQDLIDFEHPEDCMYIFGKVGFTPIHTFKEEGNLSVKISTPKHMGLLWPHQAAAIVLYDRYLKSNGINSTR